MVDFSGYLTVAFSSNYPEFPDSCLPLKLALVVNVDEMFVYGPQVLLEQLESALNRRTPSHHNRNHPNPLRHQLSRSPQPK
jgi:hypothetical protein